MLRGALLFSISDVAVSHFCLTMDLLSWAKIYFMLGSKCTWCFRRYQWPQFYLPFSLLSSQNNRYANIPVFSFANSCSAFSVLLSEIPATCMSFDSSLQRPAHPSQLCLFVINHFLLVVNAN